MRSVSLLGTLPIFSESSPATISSIGAFASNCVENDEGLPLPACLFGESLKADEAACDTPDLSLLQVRAGPARKFPGLGDLARSIQSATSEVFGKGDGAARTPGTCGFTEAETAAEVPSGKVRSYDGEITAEGCLHWCLGETMCRSAVFEPDSSSCHVLPEFYGKGNKRMLVAGSGAVAADKTCETKCKLSQPKKGKSPGSELKTLTAGTMDQCRAHCLKEKECLSLIFKAEDKTCFLKSEVADPDAEYAADDTEFSNKECHEKCSFKDPVMLESFDGSAPLEHRKATTELETCQKACQDQSECQAVLFGQDAANCYLLPAFNGSHYFSTGDAVISKKKVCDDHREITPVTNSSDALKKLDKDVLTKGRGVSDVEPEQMVVLSGDIRGDETFDAAADFNNFEKVDDADGDLVDILSDKDDMSHHGKTSKDAMSGKDVHVAEHPVDVVSEFGERPDDVAKMMADLHVDGKDEIDNDSQATKRNISDANSTRKSKTKSSKDTLSSGMSKVDAEMAELEDDGEDEYGFVFDALNEDDGKVHQSKTSKNATGSEEDDVRRAREEDEEKTTIISEEGEEAEEEEEKEEKEEEEEEKEEERESDADRGDDGEGKEEVEGSADAAGEEEEEDFTDNDEDLADVFEHLDDGHERSFVDSLLPDTSGSLDLKKLEHDASDLAMEHAAPKHKEKTAEDIRSEVRQARKAERTQKSHKSHKASSKAADDEASDLASASVNSSDAGPAPTPGPLTLDSDLDSAVIVSQPAADSVAESVVEDSKEATLSSSLDPTMEAQKAALQAILEGKTQQAQEAQQTQQAISQPQVPLPQMAQAPAQLPTQASPPVSQQVSWEVPQDPQQVPQQVPQQSKQEEPQAQSQEHVEQPMQSAQLTSEQPEHPEDDEGDKPFDLSWLSDAGVDVPNQVAVSQAADSPPLPSLPQLPQQHLAPVPQQPLAPQDAILTAIHNSRLAVAQEAPPAVLTTERSQVVQIDGPDGASVLVGAHAFNGNPTAAGVGDAPSVMDVSLKEGSGFSVAFTIDWQEFSSGAHAIDISDTGSHSDILSVSSAEDGSALSFAMTSSGIPAVLTVSRAFEVGVSARYLCTVGPTGKMQVFRDGTILGRLKPDGSYQDNTPGGNTNPAVASGQLSLGRATKEQRNSAAKTFTGWLGDVCVFPKEVLWGEAESCVVKAKAASA